MQYYNIYSDDAQNGVKSNGDGNHYGVVGNHPISLDGYLTLKESLEEVEKEEFNNYLYSFKIRKNGKLEIFKHIKK